MAFASVEGVMPKRPKKCVYCGTTELVFSEPSRTNYETPILSRWERLQQKDPLAKPKDPNASISLCRPCAEMHHDYWDELWKAYHYGRF